MSNPNPSPTTRFQPGNNANPGGKPKNARDKIGKAFLEALAKDFDAHGKKAIVDVRVNDPSTYVKVVAGLLPKEHTVGVSESLASALRRLAARRDDPAVPDEPAPLRDGGVAGHA